MVESVEMVGKFQFGSRKEMLGIRNFHVRKHLERERWSNQNWKDEKTNVFQE